MDLELRSQEAARTRNDHSQRRSQPKAAARLLLVVLILLPQCAIAFFEPRNTKKYSPRTLPRSPVPMPQIPQTLRPSLCSNVVSTTTNQHVQASFLEDFSPSPSLLPSISSLVVTVWKHLQELFSPLLQPIPGQSNTALLETLAANLGSLSFWKKFTLSLQRVGEVAFLTLLFVALMQGGLAVFQYRTNPSGELMVPPGLTVGEELPPFQQPTQHPTTNDLPSSTASLVRSGGQSNATDTTLLGRLNAQRRELSSLLEDDDDDGINLKQQSRYARILHRVNRLLVVLVPWLAGRANFILQRNAHILHIGSILTLTSIFDLPQGLLQRYQRRNVQTLHPTNTSSAELSLSHGDHGHLVVIGDSLAVGLGTVDRYDKNKTNDLPFRRIENLGDDDKKHGGRKQSTAGPAFPKSLAQTLAQKMKKRVTWRSAGVDGGAIEHIRTYCLGVIEEEVKAGRTPAAVVILCGANDMKYCLSNPLQRSNWPRSFRSKLQRLIEDIQGMAPGVTVILPAIPAQMFHKNSPMNVFPLGLLLDTMVGFWDSQKKLVADSFESKGVQYVGLSPREVSRWYRVGPEARENESPRGVTLLAKDGVHPNARCYTNWGEAIGRKVARVFRNLGVENNQDSVSNG